MAEEKGLYDDLHKEIAEELGTNERIISYVRPLLVGKMAMSKEQALIKVNKKIMSSLDGRKYLDQSLVKREKQLEKYGSRASGTSVQKIKDKIKRIKIMLEGANEKVGYLEECKAFIQGLTEKRIKILSKPLKQ